MPDGPVGQAAPDRASIRDTSTSTTPETFRPHARSALANITPGATNRTPEPHVGPSASPPREIESIAEAEREATEQLFTEYNRDHDVSPELDARFAALGAERIHAKPLRYYIWLPALRIADMWLRPEQNSFPPIRAGGSSTMTGAGLA